MYNFISSPHLPIPLLTPTLVTTAVAKSVQSCLTLGDPTGFSRQEYWSGLLFPSPWSQLHPTLWLQGTSCYRTEFPISLFVLILLLQLPSHVSHLTPTIVFQGRGKSQGRNLTLGTSLVVQWLRICLPTQGTQVRSLVREDSTCHGATKSVCHNY